MFTHRPIKKLMPVTNFLYVGHEGACADQMASVVAECQADWQLNRTADAASAIDIVMQRNISIVIAGYGEDLEGCGDLFRTLLESCPGVVRLAMIPEPLYSSADLAMLSAHQAVVADSSAKVVKAVLERAVSVRGKLQANPRMEGLLSKINTIPTPPALYFKVREEIHSPDSNAHSIAVLVARDAVLTARILRMVNSGLFALPFSIADLDHAIALLGTQTVLGLVLSVHLYKSRPLPGINMDALWRHSFVVSAVARHITSELGGIRDDVSASGVAGLLHDIGSLVLLANFPDSYPALIRQADGDESVLLLLELESLGVDHAELGGIIVDLWCLPDAVVAAVAEHHAGVDSGQRAVGLPGRAMMLAEWLVNTYARCGGTLPQQNDLDCPHRVKYSQCAQWWQFCEEVSSKANH